MRVRSVCGCVFVGVCVCVCVFLCFGWLVLLLGWLVGVVLCVGVVVAVAVVCGVWRGRLKNLRVYVQNVLRVYVQDVPVCTGTTPACVSTCGRGAGTHGDVLNAHTEGVLNIHTERGVG